MTELDIFEVLKKLRDVEKLKAILMTEDQRRLFEALPKPIISVDEEHKKKKL